MILIRIDWALGRVPRLSTCLGESRHRLLRAIADPCPTRSRLVKSFLSPTSPLPHQEDVLQGLDGVAGRRSRQGRQPMADARTRRASRRDVASKGPLRHGHDRFRHNRDCLWTINHPTMYRIRRPAHSCGRTSKSDVCGDRNKILCIGKCRNGARHVSCCRRAAADLLRDVVIERKAEIAVQQPGRARSD